MSLKYESASEPHCAFCKVVLLCVGRPMIEAMLGAFANSAAGYARVVSPQPSLGPSGRLALSHLSVASSARRDRRNYFSPLTLNLSPQPSFSASSLLSIVFFFFITLDAGRTRPVSLELSDTKVCEPYIRARLGNTTLEWSHHERPFQGYSKSVL